MPQKFGRRFQACIENEEECELVRDLGITNVEVCRKNSLCKGGLTSHMNLVQHVRKQLGDDAHIATLIRPRDGDFEYSRHLLPFFLRDIGKMRRSGADRVVIGALLKGNRIDLGKTMHMVGHAKQEPTLRGGEMGITFHRAVDLALQDHDRKDVLDATALGGADEILTSLGHAKAVDGVREQGDFMSDLIQVSNARRPSGQRMIVRVAGGIDPEDEEAILKLARNGYRFHASCKVNKGSRYDTPRKKMEKLLEILEPWRDEIL